MTDGLELARDWQKLMEADRSWGLWMVPRVAFFFLNFEICFPSLVFTRHKNLKKKLSELRPLSRKFKVKTVCTQCGTTFQSVTQPSAYPNFSNFWLVAMFWMGQPYSHPNPPCPLHSWWSRLTFKSSNMANMTSPANLRMPCLESPCHARCHTRTRGLGTAEPLLRTSFRTSLI